jgi:ribonucleoside-diphosphate reductase alpha chain
MQEMIDGDRKKREIWAKLLESRQQKGLPYIFFSDNVNRNKPQVYKDLEMTIHASNLCSEIALPSSESESFICCLSSMNLELYDDWKDTEAVKMAIYFLDAVLQEFIAKTEGNHYLEAANRFAKRHRALGLGVLGWHSYLQKNMIPFEGLQAKLLTTTIFKDIQEKAEKASVELARIYGEPELLKGYGKRNTTLLAIAPTTSSSSILGQTSPGIEPFSSNYYKAGLSKGNFMRKNKYLKVLLAEKGVDNEDTWRDIMLNHGSIMHLDILTEDEKAVFKTFKEISQLEIIQQAGIRQKYIDQAQSLNLNIPASLPVKSVNQLIIDAWKLGVKTLYYQRSQSVSKELVANLVNCASCES